LKGEEGKALENRLRIELEVVDNPAGKIVLRGSLQQPLVSAHHLGHRAALRSRPNRYPEIDGDHD
jgi:hypothetical protein